MLKQRLQAEVKQWLPAYAGGQVHGLRRQIIRFWLARDPIAREQLQQIETIRHEIRCQPQVLPAAETFLRIEAAIAEETEPARTPTRPVAVWAFTIIAALAAMLLIWQALPPGISLEWSVEGQLPTAFRVYRAPVSPESSAPSQPFRLLDELPAYETAAAYQFTDWLPLPGQNYVYRVEALDQDGQLAASQTVPGRGLDALAGQLLTLAALGLLLVSTVLVIRRYTRTYPVYFQAV